MSGRSVLSGYYVSNCQGGSKKKSVTLLIFDILNVAKKGFCYFKITEQFHKIYPTSTFTRKPKKFFFTLRSDANHNSLININKDF